MANKAMQTGGGYAAAADRQGVGQAQGILMHFEVSEITRRAIFDELTAEEIPWSGRLEEDAFLSRLYDLTKMRSTDHRLSNAAGDINQHRVRWVDWDNDWVFHDSRFNLLHAPDAEFLRFLCETVHPVVRPDPDEARRMVAAYNKQLKMDSWTLEEKRRISNRPVFEARRTNDRAVVFAEPTGWQKVDRQVQEVRQRLDESQSEEQFQAVGLLCREVLITVALEVYDPARHSSEDGIAPSVTDAKRMLEAVIRIELAGGTNEESRAHAKAALRLALALQHRRTADFQMAALCAEATSSVVNTLAILGGRRARQA